MKSALIFIICLACWASPAETISGSRHCIDLTDPNLKQSSTGFPGNSVGTLQGQRRKLEARVPLRIVVVALDASADKELLVTVQFTNIGERTILIPRSLDQRGVHEGTSGRYTAELVVRDAEGSVIADTPQYTEVRAVMFGASSNTASMYRLRPQAEVCLKVRAYSEQRIKTADRHTFGVKYSLDELKDGAYVIDKLFSPIKSENAVVISPLLNKK